MKSVFMCEHCLRMGPPEEISEHERICLHNLEAKICQNCKHFRCLEKERRDEEHKKLIEEMNKQRQNDVSSSIYMSSGSFSLSGFFLSPEDYKCFLEKTSEHCVNNDYANYAITPIVGCDSFEKRDEPIVWKSNNIMLT